MSIFSWLFNRPKRAQAQPSRAAAACPAIRRTKHFLEVDELNFHGLYRLSRSRKWAIAWRDSDPAAGRGGHRDSGLGHYVLANLNGNEVSCHGSMQRPNNGSVADNGSFCLEDWHFGSSLSGTFCAFDSAGKILLRKELTANIFQSGISHSGKFAVCATANSRTDHGNKVFFFDLLAGIELFSITPKSGWADSYEFDEKNEVLIAVVRDGGKFRYDRDGNFLDADQVDSADLNSSQYSRIIRAGEKMLSDPSAGEVQAQEVLTEVLRAKSLGADANPAWAAQLFKVQGLAHEMLGQYSDALEVYQQAIALNPKIGVKRRLTALEKRALGLKN